MTGIIIDDENIAKDFSHRTRRKFLIELQKVSNLMMLVETFLRGGDGEKF